MHRKLYGLFMLVPLAGCVHYMPAAVSNSSLGPKNEVPVKVVKGRSEASYFLFFGPFGNDSLEAAIYDAIRRDKGSSLTNTFVDRRIICVPFCLLPIYFRRETMVYGTMVKYIDETGKDIAQAPPPEGIGINDPSPQAPDSKLDGVEAFFHHLKKGTTIRLTLDNAPPYEGIYRYQPDAYSVVVRPVNGGFFSGEMFTLKHIQKAELWEPQKQ